MKCFLVVIPEESELSEDDVSRIFANVREVIPGYVWVVASDIFNTSEGICTVLGIYPTDPPHRKLGLVVDMAFRDGYISGSIVDALNSWEVSK